MHAPAGWSFSREKKVGGFSLSGIVELPDGLDLLVVRATSLDGDGFHTLPGGRKMLHLLKSCLVFTADYEPQVSPWFTLYLLQLLDLELESWLESYSFGQDILALEAWPGILQSRIVGCKWDGGNFHANPH